MLRCVVVGGLVAAVLAAVPAIADAPGTVNSRDIAKRAVRSHHLHNRAVTPAKLSGATRALVADDPFVNVTRSSPSGANGWAVSAQAIGDVGDWGITAIVICAASGPVEQASATDSTSPKSVTALCPTGDSAQGGGGFEIDAP
jgi:hypothetical protein